VKSERDDNQTPVLEKGQIWNLADRCVEIKRVGKYLVEFLMTQTTPTPANSIRPGKRMESIQAVQRFLQLHKAVLKQS
jgi:hypothetical protein